MTYASLCNETYENGPGLPEFGCLSLRCFKMTEMRLASLLAISFLMLAGILSAGTLPVSITTQSLPFGAVDGTYNAQMSATGGTGGYQWAVTQGNLPPGLVMSQSGAITGKPTAGGSYQFVVTVQDLKAQESDSKPFTIGILNIANSSPLPSGTTSNFYTVTFRAADGPQGTYVWSIDTPPDGLALNQGTGVLSGNPSTSKSFSFTITVTISSGGAAAPGQILSASKTFVLNIGAGITISTPSPLPPGDVNAPYRSSLAVIGGKFPFAWGISGGALPPGLSIVFDGGIIQGTPTSTGTSNFTVMVQDSAQIITTKPFSLTINPALGITTSSPLPDGSTSAFYSQIIAASGGTPPYSFSVSNAPQGLTITPSTGLLSGTPTKGGDFSFTITATDSSSGTPASASKTFQLKVAAPVTTSQIQVSPQSLTFAGAPGGDAPPAQSIVVLGVGGSAVAFRVVVDSGQDGSAPPTWINVTPMSGTTPAKLVVRVNQGSMPAGNFSARIRVVDSSNIPIDVPVSLVLTAVAPKLDVIPSVLRFTAKIQSPGTLEQILVVRNVGGGGALNFTATVLGSSPWITDVTPNGGQTTPNSPVFLRVTCQHAGPEGWQLSGCDSCFLDGRQY